MISHSHTAVVGRAKGLSGPFFTEPYEVYLAREVVIFLRVLRLAEGVRLAARAQISPDGVRWVDEGTMLAPAKGPGLHFVKLANFRRWFRVAGEVQVPEAWADVMTHVALKE